jgi:bacteriochlorophyllide a dehydrogenase
VGMNAAFGGASQFIISPYHKTTRLDALQHDSFQDVSVGLALPLGATALHMIDMASVAGKKVLILGQGAVGTLATEFAKFFGAEKIVATDLSAFRLSKSSADIKIHVPQMNLAESLGGMLFDVVVDCSGAMSAIEDGLKHLKMSGTVVLGGYYERIDLAYDFAFMKELKLVAAKQWALGDLERTLGMMAQRQIDFKKIFTHQSSAWNGVAEAYRTAFYDETCLKMVLDWQND